MFRHYSGNFRKNSTQFQQTYPTIAQIEESWVMEHVYTFVEIQAKLPEFWLLFVNSHKAHKAFSISEAQSVLQYAEKKPLAKF